MNIFLTIILISSVIYSIYAGECKVHNKPDYLSLASNNNDDNSDRITVSGFANNFHTVLGLSSDQNEKKEKPLFYSSRPFEIPRSTWLFHIEGLDTLSNGGIPLDDNGEFDIISIHSKLTQIGNGDALNTGTILITSESDINNLKETIKNQISQMNKEASIKYIVIICDECTNPKSIQKLEKHLNHTIDEIIKNDPHTLVMTLATKESARVRRARQTEAIGNNGSNITIATFYSDNYPVMFNLFFWTSLTLVLIVIAIVYVFLTLDPGSDTIIYRMTAPRLKVD